MGECCIPPAGWCALVLSFVANASAAAALAFASQIMSSLHVQMRMKGKQVCDVFVWFPVVSYIFYFLT